ncbi:MAG: hypothetical protein O3A51_12405, partial [Verrucomicrobia bacterium]|nr:hypothetical protein [Verrucomicrobiota bacterium]
MITIASGLMNGQVLQRNSRGVCDVAVKGSGSVDGDLVVRVTQRGKAISGFARAKIGTIRRGRFQARFKGLAIGGPYRIELSVAGNKAT